MKRLILFLLPILAAAQTQRALVSSFHFGYIATTENGDTWRFSSWSPATDGGPFNGGNVYGTFNDGVHGGSGTRNVGFVKLSAFDPNNPSAVVVPLVNAMNDYGLAGTTPSVCNGANAVKSMDNWSDGGVLYWNLFCQTNGTPWNNFASWIICSSDRGVTWENYASFLAHGSVCNSPTFGSATGGGLPGTTAGDLQWATGAHMGKLVAVQVAQDGATPPTLPGGLSNTFHYFISVNQNASHVWVAYLHRYSGNPMLPASWTHYNAGIWDANPLNATTILNPSPFSIGAFYSPKFGRFYLIADGSASFAMLTSTDLVTWTSIPDVPATTVQLPNGFTQFTTPILATMQDTPGGLRIAMASNGQDDIGAGAPAIWDYTGGFAVMDFTPPNVRTGAPAKQ